MILKVLEQNMIEDIDVKINFPPKIYRKLVGGKLEKLSIDFVYSIIASTIE